MKQQQQLTLWQEETPELVVHHFMEVAHFDGRRYIKDTACPECQATSRDMTIWSAGFTTTATHCIHQSEAQG